NGLPYVRQRLRTGAPLADAARDERALDDEPAVFSGTHDHGKLHVRHARKIPRAAESATPFAQSPRSLHHQHLLAIVEHGPAAERTRGPGGGTETSARTTSIGVGLFLFRRRGG